LTFFGWSDQHIKADGDGKHLIPAIEAMNALPGRPYPEIIGGMVESRPSCSTWATSRVAQPGRPRHL
jgi:hypothetical protein